MEGQIDRRLKKAGKESLLETPSLIELHHGRGRDELVHQALKDPLAERMPFEDFLPNVAFYSERGLLLGRCPGPSISRRRSKKMGFRPRKEDPRKEDPRKKNPRKKNPRKKKRTPKRGFPSPPTGGDFGER